MDKGAAPERPPPPLVAAGSAIRAALLAAMERSWILLGVAAAAAIRACFGERSHKRELSSLPVAAVAAVPAVALEAWGAALPAG